MTTYIIQGRYTGDAVKGMVAKPEDREAVVKKMFKTIGGKLIAYYMTFGEYDFLIVGEAPNEEALLSTLITAAASGSITNLKTTVAVSMSFAMKAFAAAKGLATSFKSAGQANSVGR